MSTMKKTGLVVLLIAAMGISACGRKGDPLKPSVSAAKQAKEDGRPAPATPIPNEQNAGKRFVLDGLLE